MEKKIFTMVWSVVLTFLMFLPTTLYAQSTNYSGPILSDGGWQTDDAEGTYTGTAGAQFIWVNEANFPDPNFRDFVLTLYKAGSYDASNGVLTSAELNKITFITCSNKSISSLQGIEFFSNMSYLDCSYNLIESLILSQNHSLHSLYCSTNNLTNLDVSNNPLLRLISCNNNNLTVLDCNNTALTNLSCGGNQLSSLIINQCENLFKLSCYDNQLTSLNVSNNINLKELTCYNNNLTSLNVSNNSELTDLICHTNQLTSLDVSNNSELNSLFCYDNQLTSLDVSNNTKLNKLSCYGNKLIDLKLPTVNSMTQLVCHTNLLTELDISVISRINVGSISTQIITPVFNTPDNRSKVGIQCHTNTGKSGHYGSFEMVEFEGNKHVIIADGTQDVEFLKSPEIIYNYNTDFSGSNNNFKQMSVAFKTSAYAMYVNPRSKMKDAPAENKKFFGTLYVDYPVVVPAEAKCYIGTGINPSTEQLELAQIASAGQVIPALTPFVVKGMDGSGFYVFRGATDEDGTPVTVSGNILAGNLEDTSVTPMSVLTLGIENGTGELGYWNYRGNTLKAHRAYVPASALSNLSSGSRGLSLAFDDATTTGVHISSVLSSGTQTAESWYTLDGRKLIGKPLQRGVYIHNGKKEIVK